MHVRRACVACLLFVRGCALFELCAYTRTHNEHARTSVCVNGKGVCACACACAVCACIVCVHVCVSVCSSSSVRVCFFRKFYQMAFITRC